MRIAILSEKKYIKTSLNECVLFNICKWKSFGSGKHPVDGEIEVALNINKCMVN